MAEFDLPTNFTGINGTQTSVQGVGSLFEYANYALGGYFGVGVVVLIWLLSFLATSLLNIGRAFASASFIAFVFSVYFARIEAINPGFPVVLLLMTILGFFWAKGEKGSY